MPYLFMKDSVMPKPPELLLKREFRAYQKEIENKFKKLEKTIMYLLKINNPKNKGKSN